MESPAGTDKVAQFVAGKAISAGLSGGNPNLASDMIGELSANAAFTPRTGVKKKIKLL